MPGLFSIKQFVVFLCTSATQAVVGEVLFTRLAQGYIAGGGGFSHYAAGRSNRSAMLYSQADWERFWLWTHANIGWEENHEREQQKWAEQLQRINDEASRRWPEDVLATVSDIERRTGLVIDRSRLSNVEYPRGIQQQVEDMVEAQQEEVRYLEYLDNLQAQMELLCTLLAEYRTSWHSFGVRKCAMNDG